MKIQEIVEAANPAQQAAIAIAKKKKQGVAENEFTISDDPSTHIKLLFLKTINGNEYRLVKQGKVYKIYVNRSTKNKQVFPSFDLAKRALQQLLLNAVHSKDQGVSEAEDERIGGRYDPNEFDAMVARLGQRAKQGPLKTVWDPERRIYKNVPAEKEVDEASLATMRDYFAGDASAEDPSKISQMRDFFRKDQPQAGKVQRKEFSSPWEYEQWLKLKQHLKK